MNVMLEASVFTGAPEWCLPLMWFARVGKHRVLPATAAKVAFDQWKEKLSRRHREAVDHAENWSIHEQANAPSKLVITVSENPNSNQVSPTTAWTILQRPYRVLLEDGVNDASFLLRMAESAERAYLEERLENEWLETDHGGGITSMPRRVNRLATMAGPLLASCLFDSDSGAAGLPSNDSNILETACIEANMHHYRLTRRAIENYLPRSAFERWISLGGNRRERQDRRRSVERYFALATSSRYHVKVKDLVGAVGSLYGDDSAMNDSDLARDLAPV